LTLLLALLLSQAGPFEQAVRDFEQERYAEAEHNLHKAIAAAPRSFDARFLLGATLVHLGRGAEAIEQLKRACVLRPGHLDALKLLSAELLRAGDAGEVIRRLKGKPAVHPKDEELHLLLLEAYHDRADTGDVEAGLTLARQSLKRFPKSAAVRLWMGFALRDNGQLIEAKQYLEEASRLDPTDPQPLSALAEVYFRENRFEEARIRFDAVLAKHERYFPALLGLARSMAELNEAGSSVALLEKARSWAGEEPQLHLELSRLYARLGESAKARQAAEAFRRLKNK